MKQDKITLAEQFVEPTYFQDQESMRMDDALILNTTPGRRNYVASLESVLAGLASNPEVVSWDGEDWTDVKSVVDYATELVDEMYRTLPTKLR